MLCRLNAITMSKLTSFCDRLFYPPSNVCPTPPHKCNFSVITISLFCDNMVPSSSKFQQVQFDVVQWLAINAVVCITARYIESFQISGMLQSIFLSAHCRQCDTYSCKFFYFHPVHCALRQGTAPSLIPPRPENLATYQFQLQPFHIHQNHKN